MNNADKLQIAVVAYPTYVALVGFSWGLKWVKFVKYSWVPVTLVHFLQLSLGTWSLVQNGLTFIWSTPVSLHFTLLIASVVFLIRSREIKHGRGWYILRFVCSTMVNFVAVVASIAVSIVGLVFNWEAEHLIQRLLCMVLVLEYLVVGPSVEWFKKRHERKHGVPLTSLDPYPGGRRATRDSS